MILFEGRVLTLVTIHANINKWVWLFSDMIGNYVLELILVDNIDL